MDEAGKITYEDIRRAAERVFKTPPVPYEILDADEYERVTAPTREQIREYYEVKSAAQRRRIQKDGKRRWKKRR